MHRYFRYGKFECGEVCDSDELKAAWQLRFLQYVERLRQISVEDIENLARLHQMPDLLDYFRDGMETDHCDSDSVHCVCKHDDDVIGYLRLTPFNAFWRLDEVPRFSRDAIGADARTVEAGRFMVSSAREVNGYRPAVSLMVLRAGLEACRQRGWDRWVLAGNVRIMRHLRDLGWPFEPIAGSGLPSTFTYHGSEVEINRLLVPSSREHDYPVPHCLNT
ncbi:hypothetical protein KJ766_03795 [Patescibacteria group bacterium]|nr:hypothetical protein [Patescibacteria group bacterium]